MKVAEHSAASGYHEWAAFAAQQSAEKAVKAFIHTLHGAARGHSVTALLRELPIAIKVPEGVLDAARELDQVYVTSRYPNGFVSGSPSDYFSETSSKRLMEHARTVFEFCQSEIH